MEHIIKTNWPAFLAFAKSFRKEAVAIIIGAVVVAVGVSLLFPLEYRAQTRLLVVLDNELNLDSFAASRSAERVAYDLSRVITSDSFLERVRATSYNLGSQFPTDLVKRRDFWARKVSAHVAPGTSVLEISAYDVRKDVAMSIVQAVSEVIVLQGSVYHGGGANVRTQVIDFPWVSRFPVRPNLIVSIVLGFVIGCVLALLYIGQRFDRMFSSGRSPHSHGLLPHGNAGAYQKPL